MLEARLPIEEVMKIETDLVSCSDLFSLVYSEVHSFFALIWIVGQLIKRVV